LVEAGKIKDIIKERKMEKTTYEKTVEGYQTFRVKDIGMFR
jgi:hypothetical protein